MASSKHKHVNVFSFEIKDENNKILDVYIHEYTTYCYSTGNTVEHTIIEIQNDYSTIEYTRGIYTYDNRDWQSFRYCRSRQSAVSKCPKHLQNQLKSVLIEKEKTEETKESEKFMQSFEQSWNKLSEKNKKLVSNNVGIIETTEQAENALRIIQITGAMQELLNMNK